MKGVPGAVTESASRRPGKTALAEEGRSLSYAGLLDSARRLAGVLAARGVREGDRVALLLPNTVDFAVAYLGIQFAGACVVPVNVLLAPPEVEFILRDAEPRALVGLDALIAPLGDLPARLGLAVLPVGRGAGGLDALVGDAQPLEAPDIDEREALAAIVYTSGTTGRPKGAMLTHHNLLSDVRAAVQVLGNTEDDVYLCVLPMFHCFAATVCMLLPLCAGGTTVVLDRFTPERVLAAIERHRVTIFAGVPSMYALLAQADPSRYDLSSWRLAVSGGASLPPAVMKRFEERYGVPVVEGDGPTECSPVTCVNPPAGPRKPGSVGLPLPCNEMMIVDEAMNPLPPGRVGEIVVRGDNVMKGYWRRPEETAEAMAGGWFHTGDLGEMDEDGYFYIVDRKKDLVIVGGMNVYPREVEDAVCEYPGVAECAVVGEPDELYGEVPVAYVIPAEGAQVAPGDLTRFLRGRLAAFKVPRRIYIVQDLPRSATGKVLKRALRRPRLD